MIKDLLKDPNTELTDEFLAVALGDSYTTWSEFIEKLPSCDIALEWRHYKDGGWLAKAVHKKKTIFWGSVSEGFFTISFNFAEKPHLRAGVQELNISDDVKSNLVSTPKGKSFSIIINVSNQSQLSDIYELIDYKKSDRQKGEANEKSN